MRQPDIQLSTIRLRFDQNKRNSQFTVHSFLEVGHIEFIPKYKKEFQQAMKIGGINLSKTQSVDL